MPTSTLIFLIVGCVRNLVLELVSSAYKADSARVPLKFFTVPQKYGKLHVIAENSQNHTEMTEQCSRCSLPTGSEASDQKSENVKSCAMPMPTYDPIIVIIC